MTHHFDSTQARDEFIKKYSEMATQNTSSINNDHLLTMGKMATEGLEISVKEKKPKYITEHKESEEKDYYGYPIKEWDEQVFVGFEDVDVSQKISFPSSDISKAVLDKIANKLSDNDEYKKQLVDELQKTDNFSLRKGVVETLQNSDLGQEKINNMIAEIDPRGEVVQQQQQEQKAQQFVQKYNEFMTKAVKLSKENIATEMLLKCAKAAGEDKGFTHYGESKKPNIAKANQFYEEIARRLIENPRESEIKEFLSNPDNKNVKERVDTVLKEKYDILNSSTNEYLVGLKVESPKKGEDKSKLSILNTTTGLNERLPNGTGEPATANSKILQRKIIAVESLKKSLTLTSEEKVIDYAQKIKNYTEALDKPIEDGGKKIKEIIAENRDTAVDKFFKKVDTVLGTRLHKMYENHFKPPIKSKGAKLVESSEKIAEVKAEVKSDTPRMKM